MNSDETIIERAKSGSQQAFRDLALAYSAHMYRSVFPILRDEKDAEDAVQEALIKVYAALPRYEGAGLKAWLTRIAVNQAIDMKRKRQRSPTIVSDEVDVLPAGGGDATLRPVLRKELRDKVRSRLDELPASYRDIIIDYYIHDKSYREIAEATQTELKTVEIKLYRARKWMRKHWKEEEF